MVDVLDMLMDRSCNAAHKAGLEQELGMELMWLGNSEVADKPMVEFAEMEMKNKCRGVTRRMHNAHHTHKQETTHQDKSIIYSYKTTS